MKIVLYESRLVLPFFWRSIISRGHEVTEPENYGRISPILVGLRMIELPTATARVSTFFGCASKGQWDFPKQIRVRISAPLMNPVEQITIWDGEITLEKMNTATYWKRFFDKRLIEVRTTAEKRIADTRI